MICDVRIDDRLIHGQVTGCWIPHYSLDKIVVIDEEILKDKTRKAALKFGCPEHVSLSFHSPHKAAEILMKGGDEGHRVMLLARTPGPLLEMVKAGYPIKRITVGNMSPHQPDDLKIKGTTYINQQDLSDFKQLLAAGTEIIMQFKPADNPENLKSFFESH